MRTGRSLCRRAAESDTVCTTFDERLAKKISDFVVPCFGCTPNKLPELIKGLLKKQDLKALAAKKEKPGA